MPEPSGQLTVSPGPLLHRLGMDGATPIAAMGPEGLENAFNVDYDRAGRPVPRPGSTFQSRIGWGSVLGLARHSFEIGSRAAKYVAIVADAFPHVHALADPHITGGVGSEEPAPSMDVGFVPDWRTHESVIIPLVARKTDRFRFESFLNRLYIAGGTLDHRVWWYDYDIQAFEPILAVKGVAVVAVGNRLFIGGDPLTPNLVYPSDPNEPETFQPQLAMQIGSRNDRIETMLEHQGMVVVLKAESAHWLLAGAIELGDFQTEQITGVHGVAGRLAASKCTDGYVYWLSDVEGPVRWRRGMGEVDTSFAKDMRPIFEAMMKGPMDGAVVEDDPANGCVRFLVPTAGCATPNWLASFYYRYPEGRWSHGASTTDPAVAAYVRDVPDKLHVRIGGPLYTALSAAPDPLLGGHAMFAGSERGIVWIWKRYSQDFQRGYDSCDRDFICMLRPGPLELATIGRRSVIHRLLFDVQAGFNWSFDVRAELDYRDTFPLLETRTHATDGGILPLTLDEEAALNRVHHPWHLKMSGWNETKAKVVRLDLRFRPEFPVIFTGFEFQHSLATEDAEQDQYPPVPFPPQELHCADASGCPPVGNPTLPPLTPPPVE